MKVLRQREAIVVLAEQHNATILHPSFLKSEGIVPTDWDTTGEIICSPVFSQVDFSNGINFRVEDNRLQISRTSKMSQDVSLGEIAARYVNVLPHVHYKGLGINADYIFPTSSATWLQDHFLKAASRNLGGKPLTDCTLSLVFPFDDSILRLTCTAVVANSRPGSFGVKVGANLHFDVESVARVCEVLLKEANSREAVVKACINFFSELES